MKPFGEVIDFSLEKIFRMVAGEYADYPRGVTPNEEVYQAGRIRLLKFPARNPSSHLPLVIVPSLINRWYILDLTPDTSFISYFSENRDCYLIDWGYAGCESAHLELSHYYHQSIRRAVRQVRRATGLGQVDMLGYCIGGTMAYMFSCLEPDMIRKLVLLTSPLDFAEAGVLGMYAKDFPADDFIDAMDYMPGWLLASSFNFIQPMGIVQKAEKFYQKYDSENFRELYIAMERWIADPVNFPARSYHDLLTRLYKNNELFGGKLVTAEGRPVDPSCRKAECMMVNAEHDHIAPAATTRFPDADRAPRKIMNYSTGHIGITVGKYGIKVREDIRNFLEV